MSELKYNKKVERFAPKLGRKNLANGLSCPPFVYMEDSDDGMWVHYAKYCEDIAELKAKLAEQEDNIMNKKKINAFDCICVTDVRISPIKQIEGLTHTKALAEVVFNDQLLIRGIRIVEGENGLYISYPFTFHPTTGEDGQPRSTVFPITKVLRDHVEAVVLEKYQDTINNKKVLNK